MKKIVFVIGTGRSGTHLLGRTISSHPLIEGHIEDPSLFHPAVNIAVKQDIVSPVYIAIQKFRLAKKYKSLLRNSSADILLEKSHPVLWYADYLKRKVPGSYFAGIIRNPFQTVSSMLNHEGVMEWYSKLPQDKPNRFLGITKENKSYFKDLPMESKCAYRWISHRKELTRLKDILKDRYLLFEYDDFLNHLDRYLEELSEFIGVDNRFSPEHLKMESLEKWKDYLTKKQIQNIESVVSRETVIH